MDGFIARANIYHFLDFLSDGDLTPEKHSTIVKLLVEDEGTLAPDREQLEFAGNPAAKGRRPPSQLRDVREMENDPIHLARVERLVATFETTQRLLDEFCDGLRTRMNFAFSSRAPRRFMSARRAGSASAVRASGLLVKSHLD